jgi:putative endonuclease
MPVSNYKSGLRGQAEAELFLRSKGYKILERNYRIRTGEIDLIACGSDYIIFAEVKFRTSTHFGTPAESVGFAKQQKIIHTAMHYIAEKNLDNQDFRFDVIEVTENLGQTEINHIEDAFSA